MNTIVIEIITAVCFAASLANALSADEHQPSAGEKNCLRQIDYSCSLDGRGSPWDSDAVYKSTWTFTNTGDNDIRIWGVLVADKTGRQIYPVEWTIPACSKKVMTLPIFPPILSGVCEFGIAHASLPEGKDPFEKDSIDKVKPEMLRVGDMSHNEYKDTISFWVYNPATIPIKISKLHFDFSGFTSGFPVDIRVEPRVMQRALVKLPVKPTDVGDLRVAVSEICAASPVEPPEVVAKKFIDALESGNITRAKKYVEIDSQGKLDKWKETLAENRQIGFARKSISSKIDGSSATVKVVSEARSNDGSETAQDTQTIDLAKENGYWRVKVKISKN